MWRDRLTSSEVTSLNRKWGFPALFSGVFGYFRGFSLCCVVLQGCFLPRLALFWVRAHAHPVPAFFSYYSISTKCTIGHDRHGYRKWVIKRHVTHSWFHWNGGVCACATGSCAISALVVPFHQKWRHQTSVTPSGFPWNGGVRACATGIYAISD
jgi:hypothetical protein